MSRQRFSPDAASIAYGDFDHTSNEGVDEYNVR